MEGRKYRLNSVSSLWSFVYTRFREACYPCPPNFFRGGDYLMLLGHPKSLTSLLCGPICIIKPPVSRLSLSRWWVDHYILWHKYILSSYNVKPFPSRVFLLPWWGDWSPAWPFLAPEIFLFWRNSLPCVAGKLHSQPKFCSKVYRFK